MKLYYSPPSPYSRKVRALIIEKGLQDSVEQILLNLASDDTTALMKANPLGKIPTLELNDGSSFYDSYVICEYLDGLNNKTIFIPNEHNARLTMLKRHALGNGMMDIAVGMVMETRREGQPPLASLIDKGRKKIIRCTEVMEIEIRSMRKTIGLDHITFACALGYIDFRASDINWRDDCPELAKWYEDFSKRPSMVNTNPAG